MCFPSEISRAIHKKFTHRAKTARKPREKHTRCANIIVLRESFIPDVGNSD
jgi:hypothetical protein